MDSTQPAHDQKVALVTGGAVQLGREIALGFARAGWDVCIHYGTSRDAAERTVQEIVGMGRRATCVQANLASGEDVKRIIPHCVATLGQPRCLVNSASTFEEDTVFTFEFERFVRILSTNLAAPLALSRAFCEAIPADAGPSDDPPVVINILDQKLYALNPDHLSYTLSKAALSTATATLAQAFQTKVRVVGLAPGLTMRHPAQPEHEFKAAHRLTPMGRASTPQDIVQACLFLATVSSVSGTTLVVDGGQHLMPQARDTMFLFKEQQAGG